MADPSTRTIRLQIIANGRYCNNDCQFMSADAKRCALFGELHWESRKKSNGNMRPRECRKAEVMHSSKTGQLSATANKRASTSGNLLSAGLTG